LRKPQGEHIEAPVASVHGIKTRIAAILAINRKVLRETLKRSDCTSFEQMRRHRKYRRFNSPRAPARSQLPRARIGDPVRPMQVVVKACVTSRAHESAADSGAMK
jgi:hypothetical protein